MYLDDMAEGGREASGSLELALDEARVRVAFLRGSARERGRQLGEILRGDGERARRRLMFWRELPHNVVRSRLPGLPPRAWQNVARLVERLLVERIARQQSDDVDEGARGLAEALELVGGDDELRRFVVAHAVYDGINLLGGLPVAPHAPASRLGCSSLVALPATTSSGALLHGRNFDLPPYADDDAPILCVHEPQGGLAHVSLHHGGGWTPGITSTNSAGLTVGVHQNYTRRISTRRMPIVTVACELIERCSSLAEAVELLHERPTAAGWSFVVSDAKAGRALVVEMDADGAAALYPPGEFLAVANCYRTTKDVHEYAFSGALREHNWCRLARLNQLAREGAGGHGPETIAAALGDHVDAYDLERRRPCGNVVAAVHNLDAVVISPGLDAIYVAVGKAPRSSADGYVGVSLSALFEGRVSRTASLESPLPRGAFRSSLEHLAAAADALLSDDDRARAAELVGAALALAPDEPIYRMTRAALVLTQGAAAEAVELLEGCADDETSPYRKGLCELLRGRALDVLGQRRAARAAYARVPELSGDVDDGLAARAAKGLSRAFTAKKARRMVVDPIFGDVPS